KGRPDRGGEVLVLGAARLEHHRNVGLAVADPAGELHAGVLRDLAAGGELDVRDDAEDVLLVVGEVPPRLLVGSREQDLRLGLEAHQPMREVDAFRHQVVRVVHQLGVDRRKERGVVADVVLDDQDRLDAEDARVVSDVGAVFDRLDDRRNEPDVPPPAQKTPRATGAPPPPADISATSRMSYASATTGASSPASRSCRASAAAGMSPRYVEVMTRS